MAIRKRTGFVVCLACLAATGCDLGGGTAPGIEDLPAATGDAFLDPETSGCVPLCDGLWCGMDDGCGGRCLACPEHAACNSSAWSCDCAGGWCGNVCCREGQECGQDGTCQGCAWECDGRWCGEDNGCGGKCLRCPERSTCEPDTWKCACPGPWCGGTCCEAGQTCTTDGASCTGGPIVDDVPVIAADSGPGEDVPEVAKDDGPIADPGQPDPGAKDPGMIDPGTTGDGAVGSACTAGTQCAGGANASCIPDTFSDGTAGWPDGYCTIFECSETAPCPSGAECFLTSDSDGTDLTICLDKCTKKSDCRAGYACPDYGACTPGCTGDADCADDELCNADLLCEKKPCTPGSCPAGQVCEGGMCVVDLAGGPGAGPGPTCSLPVMDCLGSESYCGELIPFEPEQGPGYDNYPLNGECYPCGAGKGCNGTTGTCTTTGKLEPQWRSYLRRDTIMLIQYAAAYVACKSKDWDTGNGMPVGLGDMSEKNGAIPGTSINEPGHPAGTHTGGVDIDLAYYQVTTADNHLRAICDHYANGAEQYHCTGEPNNLDVWRTALYIGALLQSTNVRVIGCDGKVGPLVEAATPKLCANGWLPKTSCNKLGTSLAYATTLPDTTGWYYFHHHHFHVSTWGGSRAGDGQGCITKDCDQAPTDGPVPQWDVFR